MRKIKIFSQTILFSSRDEGGDWRDFVVCSTQKCGRASEKIRYMVYLYGRVTFRNFELRPLFYNIFTLALLSWLVGNG